MATSHSYEIYTREANQHRPGHTALLVDGIEAELTIEPAQFMPKGLRLAIAEGVTDPAQQAIRAGEIAQQIAARAITRRIERLRSGSLIPGGVPFAPAGELDTKRIPHKGRHTELTAIESFLNRGQLRGLNKSQRIDRQKRYADKIDNDADWRQRRAALIADREAKLDKLLKADDPKAPRLIEALRKELVGLKAPILAASHGFQYAYTQYWVGAINLSSDDIRIWPYMTNTTLDTVRDAVDTFSDVTLDEFDGANYSSGGLALDNQAVAVDDANDRAEFDADDEVVAGLGVGTRDMQGIALGKFNTNTAGSLPLHAIDFPSNRTPDGSNFTFAFNAEGLLQMADG